MKFWSCYWVDDEGLSKEKEVRTDTIMLAKVNFQTGAIDILSIPRDTRVRINAREDKINNAQQIFMKELTKQVLSPKNLFNLDKLIRTYYDYVETNIPVSTMIKYGVSAGRLDIDNIRTEMVPGKPEDLYPNGKKVSYWIYDMVETDILVEDMFGDYIKY